MKENDENALEVADRIYAYKITSDQKDNSNGSSVGRVSALGNRRSWVSISGRDIPKSLKIVLAAPRLALRLTG